MLLAVRLNTGIALTDLTVEERGRVPAVVDRGLGRLVDERLVLTDRGRLLADGVVRAILD
ncbi:coproporphyrinogen dehydrogenase domain protein [Mycobacteroides abscessus subsp. bolletii 1513]|uniref:Coproporphyrinogen dehydrogenase domain protein n=1 Tax=Mycobacteroides abscessus subsp. bolletii 1513 TaxID=1299321 RepID=X8DPK8_9MYCO|nr:coproporphyrinogen dehydrogenase domain protein [Mycobacteroides abscessus subsp. bolletii 1513]